MGNEVLIRATKGQIEDFLNSILWKDIRHELRKWKKGFKDEGDIIVDEAIDTNPSTASVLLHMGDLRGRAKAVDYLTKIPNIFLQILEEKENDSRRKPTN